MSPDESVTVKGSPVRSLQKFIERELTAEQRDIVMRAVPPEFAARLRMPVLATDVMPVHLLNRITEEAARVKGEDLEAFARRVGRAGATDAVQGVYRFFALVLTPAALLSKASLMWKTLYNRGDLQVHEETARTVRIRLADFPSERVNCLRLTGWMERMAEMTGVKDVSIEQTSCYALGDPACEWQVKWK